MRVCGIVRVILRNDCAFRRALTANSCRGQLFRQIPLRHHIVDVCLPCRLVVAVVDVRKHLQILLLRCLCRCLISRLLLRISLIVILVERIEHCIVLCLQLHILVVELIQRRLVRRFQLGNSLLLLRQLVNIALHG